MPLPKGSRGTLCLLLLVVALGGYLRFQDVQQRGPSFFDDGVYTLEGKWIHSFAGAAVSAVQRKIEEIRRRENLYTFEEESIRFAQALEGEPPVWGRPGFSLLTALCMGLIGPKVYTTNVVAAFFGTLSILGVFLLGRAMFGNAVALLSALLLAISGYHLIYSVTGFADGPAMCFALFAVYFYYRSRTTERSGRSLRCVAMAGLMCGLAFTVHDRMLYVFLVLLLNEGIDWARRREAAGLRLKRVFLLASLFFLPLACFEFPYYLGMIILRHFGKVLPFRTYFEELLTHHLFNFLDAFAFAFVDFSQFPEAREAGSRLCNFLTYPYLFLKFDGVVFCLLFLAGAAAALIQKRYEDRLLLVWLVVPFVLFSLGVAASVRYALVFMPAATLIAGRSLWLLQAGTNKAGIAGRPARLALGSALVVALLLSGSHASREIRAMRCAYDKPAAFLQEHGTKHISMQFPVSKAYLGARNVKEPPDTEEQLEELYREGFRYFLIDYRKFFVRPPFDRTGKGLIIQDIESTIEPVFSFVHPCYTAPCYIFELNVFFRLTLKMVREARRLGVDQVRIYDLQEYFTSKAVPEVKTPGRGLPEANRLPLESLQTTRPQDTPPAPGRGSP